MTGLAKDWLNVHRSVVTFLLLDTLLDPVVPLLLCPLSEKSNDADGHLQEKQY